MSGNRPAKPLNEPTNSKEAYEFFQTLGISPIYPPKKSPRHQFTSINPIIAPLEEKEGALSYSITDTPPFIAKIEFKGETLAKEECNNKANAENQAVMIAINKLKTHPEYFRRLSLVDQRLKPAGTPHTSLKVFLEQNNKRQLKLEENEQKIASSKSPNGTQFKLTLTLGDDILLASAQQNGKSDARTSAANHIIEKILKAFELLSHEDAIRLYKEIHPESQNLVSTPAEEAAPAVSLTAANSNGQIHKLLPPVAPSVAPPVVILEQKDQPLTLSKSATIAEALTQIATHAKNCVPNLNLKEHLKSGTLVQIQQEIDDFKQDLETTFGIDVDTLSLDKITEVALLTSPVKPLFKKMDDWKKTFAGLDWGINIENRRILSDAFAPLRDEILTPLRQALLAQCEDKKAQKLAAESQIPKPR